MKNKKVRIAQHVQDWWDFTLQPGHAFGLYNGTCYVTAGEPDPNKIGFFLMYKQTPDRANLGRYNWPQISVREDSEIGQLFLAALFASPYNGVDAKIPKYRPHTNWRQVPQQYVRANKRYGKDCWYSDKTWYPNFPTFRSRRAEYKPIPPAPRPQKTWVDQIIAEAQAK